VVKSLSPKRLTTGHRLLTADFDSINYAYDRRINRTVLAAESHARRASLNNQHDFVNARADRINDNDMAFVILSVHIDEPRNQELAPEQALIFARGNNGSDYACKNHNQGSGAGAERSRDLK
jgi:hypothetical protein